MLAEMFLTSYPLIEIVVIFFHDVIMNVPLPSFFGQGSKIFMVMVSKMQNLIDYYYLFISTNRMTFRMLF